MEVLVSSALTVVILTMLFSVLIGAMNAWQTGTNRLQGNSDARLALDSIAQDLQSMVARQTTLGVLGQEWLYSERRPIFGLPDDFNRSATQLYFFSPSLDREPGQQGDIVAIQYQVAFADPFQGNPQSNVSTSNYNIFGLYKRMESTRDTFQNVLGLEDIWDGYWEARQSPRSGDLLIPNVVDFHVAWNITTDDVPRTETQWLRLHNQLSAFSHMDDGPRKIESADISLTILTDEGMRMVQTFARGNNLTNTNLQRAIREHGRVYTKRVKIEY
jgi:hypothetical protein